MLKNITLTNFRKHTDAAYEFSDGLHVMRGSNEAGKSTLLEGIAYALFGVKALRSPLAEAVTWGQPENTLQVVLELDVDGVEYRVTRSKAGAEVNYSGGRVTGQTEVTNFLSSKLRVDAGAAPKLMLSTQMDIRGALEAGPKATTELIERLAEFDQIDRLIETMQEKLTLGSTSVAEASLADAQRRAQELSGIVEPDFAALRGQVETLNDSMVSANAKANELNQQHLEAVKLATEAQANEKQRQTLSMRAILKSDELKAQESALETLAKEEAPAVKNAEQRLEELAVQRTMLAQQAEAASAYHKLEPKLASQDMPRFAGTASELSAQIDMARRQATAQKRLAEEETLAIVKLEAKLNNDTCSFCGKDFSELPEVQAKNAQTQALIAEAQERKAAALAAAQAAEAEVTRLQTFDLYSRTLERTFGDHAKWLSADRSTVPPTYSWAGEVPSLRLEDARPDFDGEIRAIRAAVAARQEWERKVSAVESNVSSLQREVDQANADLLRLPKVVSAVLVEQAERAGAEARAAAAARDALRDDVHRAQEALRTAERGWERDSKALKEAQETAEKAQAALKALEFNNALLKRVRSARPIIADKLWNLVLASVSSYFSEMRGEKSSVTKTSDGFLVDGHPVASLSGSTLDILGLAIRVALVRTFLPQAPFLVLDEPCASMDQTRTESLLGFLVAVGFKQILLVTHEDVSESVADHIISIGA